MRLNQRGALGDNTGKVVTELLLDGWGGANESMRRRGEFSGSDKRGRV